MSRHPIRRFSAAFAAVAALALGASASAFTPPPFPRLAGIDYGGKSDYNSSSYQDELAKLSIVILKYWPGLAPGGESMDSIVKSIEAKNPNELVFLYTIMDDQTLTGTDPRSSLRNEINAMKWWLYAGSRPVPSFYGRGEYTINSTPYTPKTADGNDAVDWITKWFVSNYYTPNPDISGLFMDNVFPQPRVSGDWYRNGDVLSPSDPRAAAALQAGYERYFALASTLMPGKYQIGNLGSWGRGGTPVPAGYIGMMNGGLFEAAIGQPWSAEGRYGWQAMMTQYYDDIQDTSAPHLVIFHQVGHATDYQAFRYGFASSLMNDGYYAFTRYSQGYYRVVWFDEYNANLGEPVTPPPTSAWQKGVWRRDFTNGIALVNPKGNGPQTVDLGGSFVKLKGSQDPSVNDGQTVTQVTLKDRDGIILLRQTPLVQPMAPSDVTAGTG